MIKIFLLRKLVFIPLYLLLTVTDTAVTRINQLEANTTIHIEENSPPKVDPKQESFNESTYPEDSICGQAPISYCCYDTKCWGEGLYDKVWIECYHEFHDCITSDEGYPYCARLVKGTIKPFDQ